MIKEAFRKVFCYVIRIQIRQFCFVGGLFSVNHFKQHQLNPCSISFFEPLLYHKPYRMAPPNDVNASCKKAKLKPQV